MCFADAFDAFQMVWHLNLPCQQHFGGLSSSAWPKKAAWPKMIRHKMPQALLVLSHVQSAIRFVNRNFSLFPQLLLSFVLINHCLEGCWFPISIQMTWEIIWHAFIMGVFSGRLSEMHGNACQQKSEAAGVAINGDSFICEMVETIQIWTDTMHSDICNDMYKYKNQKLNVLQTEESLLSV